MSSLPLSVASIAHFFCERGERGATRREEASPLLLVARLIFDVVECHATGRRVKAVDRDAGA